MRLAWPLRFWPGRASACAAVASIVVAAMIAPTATAAPPIEPSPPNPPSDGVQIYPLPVVTPVPSNWQPKYPFPYDQTRASVTDADINAMREMCQWYSQQYPTLRAQIDRLQFNRIQPNGSDYDYSIGNVGQQFDIVAGNIGQSLAFLDPRVHALSQPQNSFGDTYFPIYQGEAFFKLWEQLSNVNDGIMAHQPDWFTGPSVQKAKRWGSDIYRSHVCD